MGAEDFQHFPASRMFFGQYIQQVAHCQRRPSVRTAPAERRMRGHRLHPTVHEKSRSGELHAAGELHDLPHGIVGVFLIAGRPVGFAQCRDAHVEVVEPEDVLIGLVAGHGAIRQTVEFVGDEMQDAVGVRFQRFALSAAHHREQLHTPCDVIRECPVSGCPGGLEHSRIGHSPFVGVGPEIALREDETRGDAPHVGNPFARCGVGDAVGRRTFQVVENAHQFFGHILPGRDHVGKVVVRVHVEQRDAGIGHALGIVEREPLLARPGLCRNAACRGAKNQKQEFFHRWSYWLYS